jgi:hypothetical protein
MGFGALRMRCLQLPGGREELIGMPGSETLVALSPSLEVLQVEIGQAHGTAMCVQRVRADLPRQTLVRHRESVRLAHEEAPEPCLTLGGIRCHDLEKIKCFPLRCTGPYCSEARRKQPRLP